MGKCRLTKSLKIFGFSIDIGEMDVYTMSESRSLACFLKHSLPIIICV